MGKSKPKYGAGSSRSPHCRLIDTFRCFVHEDSPEAKAASMDTQNQLEWKHIVRVDVVEDRPTQCTICLDEGELVAPIMTPCGHVFCLHCMMRLYKYTERDLPRRKCPVCNELIQYDELRSVRFQKAKPKPKKGQRLDIALVMRGQSSNVVGLPPHRFRAPPLDTGHFLDRVPKEGDPGWYFSRLVRMSHQQHANMIMGEILRIQRFKNQHRSSGDPELVEAADHAVTYLEVRLQKMVDRYELRNPTKDSVPELASSFVKIDVPQLLPEDQPARIPPATLDDQLYFYQAADGRPIFVSSFFTKCLLRDAEVWRNLPPMLSKVRVDHVEELVVDSAFHSRYGGMKHLPIGLPILILDVDIGQLMSKDAREEFREQFQQRKNQLRDDERRRKRKDAKHEKKAERANEENRALFMEQFGYSAGPQVLPTKDDFVPLGAARLSSSDDVAAAIAASLRDTRIESAEAETEEAEEQEEEDEYPSFAQMLRHKKVHKPVVMEEGDFPTLGGKPAEGGLQPLASPYPLKSSSAKAASSSSSKPPPRTAVASRGVAAWGSSSRGPAKAKAMPTSNPNCKTGWDSDSDEDVDPELKKAYAKPSNSEAMWAAADQISSALNDVTTSPVGNAGRGKKKAKGKTIRIFG